MWAKPRRSSCARVRSSISQSSTITDPDAGRYSPAISLRRVLFPTPLGATRPVRPSPTVNDRSVNSGVSSGQENDRFEQTMEGMREVSRRQREWVRLSDPESTGDVVTQHVFSPPRVTPACVVQGRHAVKRLFE